MEHIELNGLSGLVELAYLSACVAGLWLLFAFWLGYILRPKIILVIGVVKKVVKELRTAPTGRED